MKEDMKMSSVISAINDTISISQFNRGLAGKIFDDVKKTGSKVVMKNNTAECVLMSPEEYKDLIDEVNDARLIQLASERIQSYDHAKVIAADDVYKTLGITEEDMADADEIMIE